VGRVLKFSPGDAVYVRDAHPDGHVRTPSYVRGKRGWVERIQGEFRNPESLAYGGDGLPRQPLYMVGFRQADLWQKPSGDTLYVDIYEHWLEAV
jgi:nitrile hydratase beta subunit-like protein